MNLPKPPMVMTSESKNDDISHFYLQKTLRHGERMSSGFSNLTVSTCDSETQPEACCSLAGFFDKIASILHIKSFNTSCSCPHVLIADDDNFQHFYYHTLFQKTFGYNIADSKEHLHIKLCFYGEELIERFNKIAACGCNKLMLAIIDYSMGDTKLNGVETAIKLRKSGYKGPVILRTSETEEYLNTQHIDLYFLFKTKVISEMVGKDNLKHIKEVIERYIKKDRKPFN